MLLRASAAVAALTLLFTLSVWPQAIESGTFLTESRTSSTATADKPQSKAWHHAGSWWCALADSQTLSVYRLEDSGWSQHLILDATGAGRPDCLPDGDNVYIFNHFTREHTLHKLQFDSGRYRFSEGWETPAIVPLERGSETATIARDRTGRLWIGTDAGRSIDVYYSDTTGRIWSGPIVLREDVSDDDICATVSLRSGGVGVMWSDQRRMEFGFAVHRDSDAPETWTLEAVRPGGPIADDHINLAQAADGTVYAAVKTEFDTNDMPQLGVLRRSPSGEWSELAPVTVLSNTDTGTRPIALLNEERGELYVFYTNWADSPHTISVKTTRTDELVFPQESIRIAEDSRDLNNVTSTRQTVGRNTGLLLLAAPSNGRAVNYSLIRDFNILGGHSAINTWERLRGYENQD